MAIQYVGGNTATKAGSTNGTSTISLTALSGGIAASAQIGDLVVAVFATGATADRTLSITDGTTEYTLVGSELYINHTGYDANLRVAYKLLTANDASTTFGFTGNAADAGAMAVHVWRGVDPTNIFDVAATTATGGGTGRPKPPAITPATTGSVIVMAGSSAIGTGALFTATDLANFRTATSADSNDATVGIGSVTWTSGTYTPAQWTGGTTNAADSWAAVTLALRPKVISGPEYVGGNITTTAGSASANTTLSLTALTGGIASSAQSGDLVISVFSVGALTDVSLSITDGTNDYTLAGSELYSNGNYDSNLRVAYKLLTANDASVTFGPTGSASNGGVMAVYVWRGIDSSVLDATTVTATGAPSGSANPPAITPVTEGSIIVCVGGSTRPETPANPNLINFVSGFTSATYNACLGIGAYTWTSGTYDPGVMTTSASSVSSWTAVTMALKPASTVQTLTPTRYDSTQTFHAPTVTPGEVALSPSLFSNDATFHAATVSLAGAAQEVSPGLLSNAQTFHAATVAASYSLSPALFSNSQTFFAPTLTASNTLQPQLFSNAQAYHAPTITASYSLLPALYSNSQDFFGPTASSSYILSPALLGNAQAFHAAIISAGAVSLTPARLDNSQAFHGPTVATGAITLLPGLVANTGTFYAATISQGGVTLSSGRLDNAQTFYGSTVTGGTVTLAPVRLDNAQTFHGPTVDVGAVALTPSLFSNAQAFHAASIIQGAVSLTPSPFGNNTTFYAPSVTTGAVVLAPDLFSSTPQFYSASVSTGAVTLAPPRLDNAAVFFAAAVTQVAGPQQVLPGLLLSADTIYPAEVTAGEVTLLAALLANEQTFHAATATPVAAPAFGTAILAETSQDVLSAAGAARVQGVLAALEGADSAAATGTLFSSFVLTGRQALLLKQLAQLHGLIEPMTVGPTQRVVGDLVQTVVTTGGTVMVQTVSSGDTFHGDAGLWIERLAALHGIGADLRVTPTERSAGPVLQSFEAIGQSTLVVTQ